MATITKTNLTDSQKFTIEAFVAHWEKFANAYFWTSPSSASGRRSYEKYQSRDLSIEIDGDLYVGSIDVSCSCKNVYVNRSLTVNGEAKRITALKNFLK